MKNSSLIKKDNLNEILGYDLLEEEYKNQIVQNPKLKAEIERWANKYVDNRFLFGVKNCNVDYINYEELDIDEYEDEVDRKELLKKIKNNERSCPNHRNCPLYKNQLIKKGEKCLLELADAQDLVAKYCKELEIKPEDYNDQVMLNQLVTTSLLSNRALIGLSSGSLVEQVVTVGNGGTKYDTKINENLIVFEKSMNLSDKIKKALVMNRDDKIKLKKLKEGKNQEDVINNVKNVIKEVEEDFDINDVIELATVVEKPKDKIKQEELNI